MLPEEVYKRRPRHNNTPESITVIIANFVVVSIAVTLFADRNSVNWFFWVVIGFLALYNAFTIRRNREDYNKITKIVYIASLLVLVGVFFLFKSHQG
jgi:heme O synthase-like polyprenyltransferase